MKRLVIVGTVLMVIASLGLDIARAQAEPAQQPSLGDVARQLKAKRGQTTQQPAKVITNDNLPVRPPEEENLPVSGDTSKSSGDASAAGSVASSTSAGGSSETRDENYYRREMGVRQGRLEKHRRQLDVLEKKLAQNQMQFYDDPNRTLQEEFSRADVTKLTQDIEKKKEEIKADEQALADLEDQLRRDGGHPGWLRGPSIPEPEPAPEPAEQRAGESEETKPAESETPEERIKTKEYWQDRFKSAKARVARAEEEQQLAEDELSLLRVQQARELTPEVQNDIGTKVKAKTDDLEVKRTATGKARKALENLEKQFKASGAPDEWSKTE